MKHPSGVVFHFSLFKVKVFRLVVRQPRWQAHSIAVLIPTATSTRWPIPLNKKLLAVHIQ